MSDRLKMLCLLLPLVALGTPSSAQDFSSDSLRKAFPYKDLPGVRPSDAEGPKKEEPTCTQEVRLQNAMRRDSFGDPGPGMVYRCEKDGITVESARPPLRKYWNPLEAQ